MVAQTRQSSSASQTRPWEYISTSRGIEQPGSIECPPDPLESPVDEQREEPPAVDAAVPHSATHYANFFASADQREWSSLMAIEKSDNIRSICRNVPHESILDVGSGDGEVLNRLDHRNFGTRLCAIDITDAHHAEMRGKVWKHLDEVKTFDGKTIPYPDQSFDLVVLSHVVEYLECPRAMLREAGRVGRNVYIEVPLQYHLTNPRLRREGGFQAGEPVNYFTPALIRLLALSSDLHVMRQETRRATPKWYSRGKGRKAHLGFWLREATLRVNERLATTLFPYHGALLCTRDSTTP